MIISFIYLYYFLRYNFLKFAYFYIYSLAELFNVTIGNPAKYHSLAKNLPKYTTAYTVQQSNCRWLCDPTFFLKLGLNNQKSIQTLSLQSLYLLSLHLETLRLVSLVSLIIKTYRISQGQKIRKSGLLCKIIAR